MFYVAKGDQMKQISTSFCLVIFSLEPDARYANMKQSLLGGPVNLHNQHLSHDRAQKTGKKEREISAEAINALILMPVYVIWRRWSVRVRTSLE
jgi:hypothetical protein